MTTQQHTSPGALLANDEPAKRDRFANGHLIWDTIIELRNTERRINRRALRNNLMATDVEDKQMVLLDRPTCGVTQN